MPSIAIAKDDPDCCLKAGEVGELVRRLVAGLETQPGGAAWATVKS